VARLPSTSDSNFGIRLDGAFSEPPLRLLKLTRAERFLPFDSI
jgi:hypothetical protein